MRYYTTVFKLTLLLAFALVRNDVNSQAIVMLTINFIYHFTILYQTGFDGPFRKSSTNRMWIICGLMLFVNNIFGMVTACGVRNAVTVASIQTLLLFGINILGVASILYILICATVPYILKNSDVDINQIVVDHNNNNRIIRNAEKVSMKGSDVTETTAGSSSAYYLFRMFNVRLWKDDTYGYWPSICTLKRLSQSDYAYDACKAVRRLSDAMAVMYDCYASEPETADIFSLEECIRLLQRSWLKARHRGSLLQVLLSDNLETLILFHSKLSPKALRIKRSWDEQYTQSRKHLNFRRNRYILTAPRKRRILLKLLAMSAFQNNVERQNNRIIDTSLNRTSFQNDAEISKMRIQITEAMDKALVVLDKADEENTAAFLVMSRSDQLKLIDDLVETSKFWKRIVMLYDDRVLPGWKDYPENEVQDWFFILKQIQTRIGELKHDLDDGSSSDEETGSRRNGQLSNIPENNDDPNFDESSSGDDSGSDDVVVNRVVDSPRRNTNINTSTIDRSNGGGIGGDISNIGNLMSDMTSSVGGGGGAGRRFTAPRGAIPSNLQDAQISALNNDNNNNGYSGYENV